MKTPIRSAVVAATVVAPTWWAGANLLAGFAASGNHSAATPAAAEGLRMLGAIPEPTALLLLGGALMLIARRPWRH